MARLIGYARVSTEEQNTAGQRQALQKAGCALIFEDVASGASRARPQLKRCLEALAEGDTLVVPRLDRLARSVKHLYEVVEDLERRGVSFRSLHESFDTTTPSGRLMLGMLTLIAQFERELIHERSRAGIAAAQARGVKFGNPAMRRRDRVAIDLMKASQADTFLRRARSTARPWIDHVVRFRPERTWQQIHQYLRLNLPKEQVPTPATMVATVKRLVAAGDVPQTVLNRAAGPTNDTAATLARRIAAATPNLSLRAIARELNALDVKPVRASAWSAQTVSRLLADRDA